MIEIIEPGYKIIEFRRLKCFHCNCIFISTENEFDKTSNFDPLYWTPTTSTIQYTIECPYCNYSIEMSESVFKNLPIENRRIPLEKS